MQAGKFQKTSHSEDFNSTSFAPTLTLSPTVQVTLAQQESQSAQLPWEEAEKQVNTTQSVFMVPFTRDANFLGKTFQMCHSVTLSGLGGIGWVHIFVYVVHQFFSLGEITMTTTANRLVDHPSAHIFWVYGADPLHFEQGYQEIARRARIPGWDDQKTDKLKLVQEWLQEENTTEWLMVVDNADDATMFFGARQRHLHTNQKESKSFARFLPQCPHGRILITTRDRRLGERLSNKDGLIQISTLSAEHSKDLLRSKISEDNWSEDDALKLVEYLSALPLAITQAALS
ncbi:MAG: hypothetical protein Q9166_003601 [cf. Caloplaca sp. 2 TL-2023]